jgi:hypothetical protein
MNGSEGIEILFAEVTKKANMEGKKVEESEARRAKSEEFMSNFVG